MEPPSRHVRSADGTSIAVFTDGDGPPLVLVHGAAADHTTWRVSGPLLGRRFTVHAIDRRGRGASGDGPIYDIEREFEDVAGVADAVAAESGGPVVLVGHSLGGRISLGAALRTTALAGVVCYEGAPAPLQRPYQPRGARARLQALLDGGRHDELLETFLREVVGLGNEEVAAYRASPVWPVRVAAAPTVLREVDSEGARAGELAALRELDTPVLQVLGGSSPEAFREATFALDRTLPRGRVAVIEGAKHAAHHTHADRFVAEIVDFVRSDLPHSAAWTSSAG